MRGTLLFVLVFAALQPDSTAADLTRSRVPAEFTALGDKLYRDGRFGEAQTAYERALESDDRFVKARLGLGRIASLLSDVDLARMYYSRAFQINPSDPDAILAFASIVTGKARETLLANFLAVNRDGRNSDVKARLEIERKLAGRALETVVDAQLPYRLPVSEQRNGTMPNALVLQVRVNGGRPLDLLLDSGARGLVLNPSAGREARLEPMAAASLFGFGSDRPTLGQAALAAKVEVGEFRISNVLVEVSDTDLPSGTDGLVGLELFKDFVIHLNTRTRALELEPFETARDCAECFKAYRLDHLLLVPGKVNGQAEGNFVLDTGSPITLVSGSMVAGSGGKAWLVGAQGEQEISVRASPLSFRIGPRKLLSFEYATLDTAKISARHGTAIAGTVGYFMLRNMNLTVDYRHGLVKLSQ